MHVGVRRAVQVAVITGAMLITGAGAASANSGLLGGDLLGGGSSQGGLLGGSNGGGLLGGNDEGGLLGGNDEGGLLGGGDGGVLSGNQVVAPVSVPLVACGNAVSLAGEAEAACVGRAKSGRTHANNGGTGGDNGGSSDGIGSGNQVVAPVSAPAVVCGNALGILDEALAVCEGNANSGDTDGGNGGGGNGGGDDDDDNETP